MEFFLSTNSNIGISLMGLGVMPCDCSAPLPRTCSGMNLADPELELIDPTPNVHALFVQFDKIFFDARLVRQTVVNWSKRMYSCAGVCKYDRRSCTISLSEPLLKLRPRKDLVETLLHEMIHAYLFVTNNDWDRDGHGPNFQAHMHRINKAAGLNISIYHDFHDEVKVYQTHWWRCNGPCQGQRPHFGIVRRSSNRAPGPSDYWWSQHQRTCGGQFVKIKEPEKKTKAKTTKNAKTTSKGNENVNTVNIMGTNIKTVKTNNNSDITKYVTTKTVTTAKPVPKTSNIHTINTVNSDDKAKVFTGQVMVDSTKIFTGNGNVSGGKRKSVDAATAVKNVWANKNIPGTPPTKKTITSTPPTKNKAPKHEDAPPAKTRKIEDYFPKASAILKDLYGDEIQVSKKDENIIISVAKPQDFVDCPVCKAKVDNRDINKHLDECLNKDLLEKLSKENINTNSPINIKTEPSPSQITNDGQFDTKAVAGTSKDFKVLSEPSTSNNISQIKPKIKIEPSTSSSTELSSKCACCGKVITKSMDEHLDECLAFFTNNTTIPEKASTSFETIEIDDDLDESQTFNETGTKYPCPCCMEMVESDDMNRHLDACLR